MRRYIDLDQWQAYDLWSDQMPSEEAAQRLLRWCRRRYIARASLETFEQIGFILGLLRFSGQHVSSPASEAQLEAMNDGEETGASERLRRLHLAGVDTSFEERQDAEMLALWEKFTADFPADLRAHMLGIASVDDL